MAGLDGSGSFDPNALIRGMTNFDAGGSITSAMMGTAGQAAGVASAGGGAAAAAMGMGAMAGPIGMVATSILGGIQAAQAKRDQRDVTKVNAENTMLASAYEMALGDWYSRRDKGEKRMGLENYKQFNTMEQIMPGYKDVYTPGELGDMPNVTDYVGHRRNKKVNAKHATTSAQAQSTVGSVTVPGG